MCGEILDQYPDIKILKKLHSKIIVDQPLHSNPSLGMKLTRAYAARGEPSITHNIYDEIPEKNIVFLNVMIRSCGAVVEFGLDLNFFMGNGLVAMYGKCGCLMEVCKEMEALRLKPDAGTIASLLPAVTNTSSNNVSYVKEIFMKLPKKSVVSWNVMTAVWKKYRIEPDAVTIASVLPACGDPLALSLGRQMHEYVEMKKLRPNLLLENSLVDMYAKCGSLQDAREVFDRTKFHDVVSRTSMISAFGLNGQGLLEKGQYYFKLMTEEYRIIPRIEHYACVVDFLRRSGQVDEMRPIVLSSRCQLLCLVIQHICNVVLNDWIHTFLAGDQSHPHSEKIYEELDVLVEKMKELGYVPETGSALHDVEEDKEFHLAVHTKLISKIVELEIIIRDANCFHHFKNGLCSFGDSCSLPPYSVRQSLSLISALTLHHPHSHTTLRHSLTPPSLSPTLTTLTPTLRPSASLVPSIPQSLSPTLTSLPLLLVTAAVRVSGTVGVSGTDPNVVACFKIADQDGSDLGLSVSSPTPTAITEDLGLEAITCKKIALKLLIPCYLNYHWVNISFPKLLRNLVSSLIIPGDSTFQSILNDGEPNEDDGGCATIDGSCITIDED
uniref:DYW domain-containing protein n=1 Tax=Quercus lobata TaxID=97700 RepID=A0A7N2MGQ3_QUELO